MGRHALVEDVVPSSTAAAPVRSVAEIIAAHRRDQLLPAAGTDVTPVGPWTARRHRADGEELADLETEPAVAVRGPLDPRWEAALQPNDELVPALPGRRRATAGVERTATAETAPLTTAGPRRRRAAGGAGAASVIAMLTAELAETHPGLLEGSPHSRRAGKPVRTDGAHRPLSTMTNTGRRLPESLQPVKVGGVRGAALRVPALTGGFRLPARTPLVLAGAVALTVVVTDQAGLLSAAAGTPNAAGTGGGADTTTTADTHAAASAAAAAQGAAQAQARVSRLQRSTPTTADATAVTAGSATPVSAAPPPDSVMKPGQTIPGDWVRPSPTGIYNSCFCGRWGTFHYGIDFAAPLGSPILAVGDGVVVDAGPASGFGNWVVIQHANGDMSIYGHMKYFFVKVGQHVVAGQEIALVGEEGEATGPHLHLGIKIGSTNPGTDGTYIDPVPWLAARGIEVGAYNPNG